ncbi:nucleoside diphosphate kinase regulator [Falsigemmobacter faecalis]|uniref:Nucleoside diphosphate kinase regulator n=1 Tax=Falsigemmobacter faecalis TaxID=2488730 RepID=A0A3P3DR80_9RHOB|nr:nucleoside diphosphate kinase regulator [Falsigemmobacter faecalis]RRH76444.1 nucleoside diphosphate kinase regulator [Falsigemmobacter faecalis]
MSPMPHPPPILIDADKLSFFESLAEGLETRFPDLADRFLEELSRAEIRPAGKMPADVVDLGRQVTYVDETTGREQTITLVRPEEADITSGRAAVNTPVGIALLGLRKGASFNWQARDGRDHQLKILAVN